MGLGLGDIWKIKAAWDKFTRNHPKFPAFLNAVQTKGVPEDTVLGLTVTYPDGQKLETNLKVTREDLDLIEELRKIKPN